MPFEIPLEEEKNLEDSPGDYAQRMLHLQKIAFEAAENALREEQDKFTSRYNETASPTKVRVGYRVFVEAIVPAGKSKKLAQKYEGPYRVLKDLGKSRFVLKSLITGKERQVHADRTKIVPEDSVCTKLCKAARLPFPAAEKIQRKKNDTRKLDNTFQDELDSFADNFELRIEYSTETASKEQQSTETVDTHSSATSTQEGGVTSGTQGSPSQAGNSDRQLGGTGARDVPIEHSVSRYGFRKRLGKVRYKY